MEYFLGVDGGGTKTEVVCVDAQGTRVGQGRSGPTNLTATNVGAASFNLREAVRQATEGLPEGYQIKKMVMGLAGVDTPQEEAQAKKVFENVLADFPVQEFVLVNDIVIALASGTTADNAVALIAGTGSNCFGHNAQGETAKTGGMDYILTDEGSGYRIGFLTLRAAVQSFDGRIEKSLLEDKVREFYKLDTIANIKHAVYSPPLTKAEIATLSKVCVEAFEAGDTQAQAILDLAVTELYLMVATVLKKLDMLDKQVNCVFVGGITNVDYICENLEKQLQAICPEINFVRPEVEPVQGAIRLALS